MQHLQDQFRTGTRSRGSQVLQDDLDQASLRLTGRSTTGRYTSRVMDAQQLVTWNHGTPPASSREA